MLLLMNSAMMPNDGIFLRETITSQEFKKIFLVHSHDWESFIGYNNTAAMLSHLLGIPIPLNRENTVIKEGDFVLAVQLRYRVPVEEKSLAGGARKHGGHISDYEFRKISFFPISDKKKLGE